MSIFEKTTQCQYVEAMRKFLGLRKKGFLEEAGFRTQAGKVGRLRRFDPLMLGRLEARVNEKAARVDAKDTTLSERIRLARDYQLMTDSQIGRAMGVTRELVRRWGVGLNKPTNLEKLARVMNVPVGWLEVGDATLLRANSLLGVRVGRDAAIQREALFALTQQRLSEVGEYGEASYIQASLEWAVFDTPALASRARKAGGRWQYLEGSMHFVPWVPVRQPEIARRDWSDAVENIISEELARPNQTVARAWAQMQQRCKALGLKENEYPKRISLFKRVQKRRMWAEKYGVDLNSMIEESVLQHSRMHRQKTA